jgi:hypothetical protein
MPNAEKPEFDLGPLEHKAKFLYPSVFGKSLDAWEVHLIEREPYHKRSVCSSSSSYLDLCNLRAQIFLLVDPGVTNHGANWISA